MTELQVCMEFMKWSLWRRKINWRRVNKRNASQSISWRQQGKQIDGQGSDSHCSSWDCCVSNHAQPLMSTLISYLKCLAPPINDNYHDKCDSSNNGLGISARQIQVKPEEELQICKLCEEQKTKWSKTVFKLLLIFILEGHGKDFRADIIILQPTCI